MADNELNEMNQQGTADTGNTVDTMPESFKQFMQMYTQANKPTIGNVLMAVGEGLKGFSAPMLGQSYTPPKRNETGIMTPSKMWNEIESMTKLQALEKMQKGQKLSPYELKALNMTPEASKLPTWGQQQKMSALRSGINRGRVVIGREFGEPEEFPIKSQDDVFRAIELSGFSPDEFKGELEAWEGRVLVQNKDGVQGLIYENELQSALKEGYRQVR